MGHAYGSGSAPGVVLQPVRSSAPQPQQEVKTMLDMMQQLLKERQEIDTMKQ